MGNLVRNGGNMTAEVVNREVLDALDQLRKYAHNTSEQRRLAACHMLKELAGAPRLHARRRALLATARTHTCGRTCVHW